MLSSKLKFSFDYVLHLGQMNPANPNLYRVLQDLYTDIVNLWTDSEVFHMGGDEVISIQKLSGTHCNGFV